jgi:hypothetical protein
MPELKSRFLKTLFGICDTRKVEMCNTREVEICDTREVEICDTREVEICDTREVEIYDTREVEICDTRKVTEDKYSMRGKQKSNLRFFPRTEIIHIYFHSMYIL